LIRPKVARAILEEAVASDVISYSAAIGLAKGFGPSLAEPEDTNARRAEMERRISKLRKAVGNQLATARLSRYLLIASIGVTGVGTGVSYKWADPLGALTTLAAGLAGGGGLFATVTDSIKSYAGLRSNYEARLDRLQDLLERAKTDEDFKKVDADILQFFQDLIDDSKAKDDAKSSKPS